MYKDKRVSIIIPTHNERENIILLLTRIEKILFNKIDYEVIVIDDDSPDETAGEIKKNLNKIKNIRLFVRKKIRGLATAILFGIKKAKGEIIIGMDADFNHPPELIPGLIDKLENADLTIASRFIKGGGMDDKFRYVFTYIFNLILKYFLGFPTTDNMSGFYSIKKLQLLELPIEKIYHGYGEYHLRLVYLAKKHGLKIKEIPVFYIKRRFGKSKSNLLKMFFNYISNSFSLRIKDGKI